MQTAVKGILRIKTEDYRFWMKFAQFTVVICKKLFVRARSVMCFLLDNIAVQKCETGYLWKETNVCFGLAQFVSPFWIGTIPILFQNVSLQTELKNAKLFFLSPQLKWVLTPEV